MQKPTPDQEAAGRIENLLKIFPSLTSEQAKSLDKRLVLEVERFFKEALEIKQDLVSNETFLGAYLVYVRSNIATLIRDNLG